MELLETQVKTNAIITGGLFGGLTRFGKSSN